MGVSIPVVDRLVGVVRPWDIRRVYFHSLKNFQKHFDIFFLVGPSLVYHLRIFPRPPPLIKRQL